MSFYVPRPGRESEEAMLETSKAFGVVSDVKRRARRLGMTTHEIAGELAETHENAASFLNPLNPVRLFHSAAAVGRRLQSKLTSQ